MKDALKIEIFILKTYETHGSQRKKVEKTQKQRINDGTHNI